MCIRDSRNTGYKGDMYAGFHVVQGSPSEGMGTKCREAARRNPPVGCNRLVHESNAKLKGYGFGGKGGRDSVGIGGAAEEVRERMRSQSGVVDSRGGDGDGGGNGRVSSGALAEAATALVVRRQSAFARLAKAWKLSKSAGRRGGAAALEAALGEVRAARVACFSTAAAVAAAAPPDHAIGSDDVANIAGCSAYEESLRKFAAA